MELAHHSLREFGSGRTNSGTATNLGGMRRQTISKRALTHATPAN